MFVAAIIAHSLALAPAVTADPKFSAAVAEYDALEFERAALAFQRIPIGPLNDESAAHVLLWEGVCFGQMGDAERARGYFARALLRSESAKLPVEVPPPLAALFVEVREELASRAPEPVPWGGIALVAGGSVAGTAAAAFGVGAMVLYAGASDETTPPKQAIDQVNAANLNLYLSVASAVVAAAGIGTGIWVLTRPIEEDESRSR